MARGKQENKPLRKQKRMRPTPPKSKPSCPFLSLPPELTDAIVEDIPNVHSLILTCTALYNRYRLRVVVDHFHDNPDSLGTVYCLNGVEEGEFGWKPFSIFDASFGDRDFIMDEEDPDYVYLVCIEHKVTEFRKDTPTRAYLSLEMTESEVFVDFNFDNWIIDTFHDCLD